MAHDDCDLQELPARILLQIREGVSNVLVEGTIASHKREPVTRNDAPDGAHTEHYVTPDGIITLLIAALRKELESLRKSRNFGEWRSYYAASLLRDLGLKND